MSVFMAELFYSLAAFNRVTEVHATGVSLFETNTLRVRAGFWQGMPLGLSIRFGVVAFS
jgi:hypothetical protein